MIFIKKGIKVGDGGQDLEVLDGEEILIIKYIYIYFIECLKNVT